MTASVAQTNPGTSTPNPNSWSMSYVSDVPVGQLMVAISRTTVSAVTNVDVTDNGAPSHGTWAKFQQPQGNVINGIHWMRKDNAPPGPAPGNPSVTFTFNAQHTPGAATAILYALSSDVGWPVDPVAGNTAGIHDTASPFIVEITTSAVRSIIASHIGNPAGPSSFADPAPAEGWNDRVTHSPLFAQDLLNAPAGTYTADRTSSSPPVQMTIAAAAFLEEAAAEERRRRRTRFIGQAVKRMGNY